MILRGFVKYPPTPKYVYFIFFLQKVNIKILSLLISYHSLFTIIQIKKSQRNKTFSFSIPFFFFFSLFYIYQSWLFFFSPDHEQCLGVAWCLYQTTPKYQMKNSLFNDKCVKKLVHISRDFRSVRGLSIWRGWAAGGRSESESSDGKLDEGHHLFYSMMGEKKDEKRRFFLVLGLYRQALESWCYISEGICHHLSKKYMGHLDVE